MWKLLILMESIVFLHDILWQIYLCETKCCCWTLSIVFLDMTSFSQISLRQLSIELHSLAPTPSWSTQISTFDDGNNHLKFRFWISIIKTIMNFHLTSKKRTMQYPREYFYQYFSVLQGAFFNCSSRFLVPKWKTSCSQPGLLFSRNFQCKKAPRWLS